MDLREALSGVWENPLDFLEMEGEQGTRSPLTRAKGSGQGWKGQVGWQGAGLPWKGRGGTAQARGI